MDDRAEMAMAEEMLESVNEQLNKILEQMQHLTVVAPISGKVIAPPRRPAPKIEQYRTRLGGWTGTPLDAKNFGEFLEDRTELLSIAPSDKMQAILFLDQADRHDVSTGLNVGLKFDHLPNRVFRGTISQIATAHSDFAPETMASKNGGLLATTADREGREQLQEAAYQATVVLDESTELLTPNLRGTARFMAANRSAFGWMWRYIRRTFHFKM